MAVRQSTQPIQPGRADHVDCPSHNSRSVVVEPFKDLGVRTGSVVIADQRQPTTICDLIYTSLRVASVPDNITQAQCFVDRRAVVQNRLQRLPVGVDVREDRYLQAGFS